MRRDEVLALLEAHRDELQRFHIKSLALFGSVARDEAGPESDIDVLVELARTPSLFTLIALEDVHVDLLGSPVDVTMRNSLRPAIGEHVLADAIPVNL